MVGKVDRVVGWIDECNTKHNYRVMHHKRWLLLTLLLIGYLTSSSSGINNGKMGDGGTRTRTRAETKTEMGMGATESHEKDRWNAVGNIVDLGAGDGGWLKTNWRRSMHG